MNPLLAYAVELNWSRMDAVILHNTYLSILPEVGNNFKSTYNGREPLVINISTVVRCNIVNIVCIKNLK